MYPSDYLSIIVDGMAQNHSQLPWQGNLKEFHPHMNQHLCGVLNHGRSFTMYRTTHTAVNNSNLVMQCILLTLEDTIQKEGKLPGTLYIQVLLIYFYYLYTNSKI